MAIIGCARVMTLALSWGGFDLGNYPYRLVKYEKNEEMVDTNFTNINDTDTDNGES